MSERDWIEYGKTWKEFSKNKDDRGELVLAVPGTRIEVDGSIYLIGDVNPAGGVCNCCAEFGNHAIVSRYLPPTEESASA